MMDSKFLDKIFALCEISNEDKEFIINKLFKYENNPVVLEACALIRAQAINVSALISLFNDIKFNCYNSSIPLIVCTPNNASSLRIYQNIPINGITDSGLANIQPLSCTTLLKDFLASYEADMLDEKRSQKWEPSRISTRLNEYIDMPTAKALTRFIVLEGALKDNQIRDIAEAIDNLRKPMELLFADTPEDFTIMYGSGPDSCMAYSAAGKNAWECLNKYNLYPASWYAFYPYTRGCYVLKNKKVIARAILFKDNDKDKWYYGRIYANNQEIHKKFQQSLVESGFTQITKSVMSPPPGTQFKIPGYKSDNSYVCPWPYFDNLSRESGEWGVSFDDKTKEFTIQFIPTKLRHIYNRGGHLNSKDYVNLFCDNCGTNINLREIKGTTCTEDKSFCCRECALQQGFITQLDGLGQAVYTRKTDDLIPVFGTNTVLFSTLRAARDNGYYPLAVEAIIPEDTDLVVTNQLYTKISSKDGYEYGISKIGYEDRDSQHLKLTINNIPIYINKVKKLVEYNGEFIKEG